MSVASAADAGWVIGGARWNGAERNYDVVLIGVDSLGQERWTRTNGGSGYDHFEVIRRTRDGGYIVAGAHCEPCSPRQPNWSTHFDAFIVRLTETGDTVWTRRLGSDGNDLAYFVTVTSRGTFMVGGATTPPDGFVDTPWLIELGATGETQWTRVLENAFPRNGVAQVREIAKDEFLVTGPPWLYQRDSLPNIWVTRIRR